MQTLVLITGAYFLGSINSAVLLCRLAGLSDPRQAGSGNPGATNVYRIGGRILSLATLLFDIAKGALPALLAHAMNFSPQALALVVLAAALGHCYPLFFGFNGGKGVATALGALLALSLPLGLCLVGLWTLVFLWWRYSSLASISCAAAAPMLALYWLPEYLLAVLLLTTLLLWRHRPNVQRLRKQSEPRLKTPTNNQH